MPIIDRIWGKIILEPWFYDLPPWLQNKTNALIAVAGLLVLLLLFVWFFFLRGIWIERRNTAHRRAGRGGKTSAKELSALRKAGNFLELGRRLEDHGKSKKALAAYRKGGHGAEAAELLLRMGKLAEARREARDGEVWDLYAQLSRDAEDLHEAAAAFERAQKPFEAAQAWERAGEVERAARAYLVARMPYDAVRLLDDAVQESQQQGSAVQPQQIEALETALRAGFAEARGASMSPESVAAVRRAAQAWLSLKEPERGYQLAVDAEQWSLAVPIARDYLTPNPAAAEICLRAGDRLAAAEIYRKLGAKRREAICRGEHLQATDPRRAADWFVQAEEWAQAADLYAAQGEKRRAAELYERAEELELAEHLFLEIGDDEQATALRERRSAQDPQRVFSDVDTADKDTISAGPTIPSMQSPDEEATLKARPQLGQERYRIVDELGRGAMGVVYRAWDSTLDRHVAYKALPREKAQEGGGAEILAEARAAAKLSHPNIVQIYDAGLTQEGYFLVMELIEGSTFQEILKEQRLSMAGVLTVGGQILAALQHAHERKLVHRDLKPSNLMWTGSQVKLADFGLARFLEATQGQVETRAAGTPYYMAPEQIRGQPVSPATDLYSFGCVFYEMLCRRTPFRGEGSAIYHHLNTIPEDPRETRADLPLPLAKLILQCLEKDPANRPASARSVAAALQSLSSSLSG